MTTVFVVDLDKTIANHSHRDKYLKKSCSSCSFVAKHDFSGACPYCQCDIFTIPTSSWKAYSDALLVANDAPVAFSQDVILKAMEHGVHVHYITARQNAVRSVTQNWLIQHFGFKAERNRLLMRDDDLKKPGRLLQAQHKEAKFFQLLEMCGYTLQDTFMFFDDDISVLENYNRFGLTFRAPECWEHMNFKPAHK